MQTVTARFKVFYTGPMDLEKNIPFVIKKLQLIDDRPKQIEINIKMVALKEVEGTDDGINRSPIIVQVKEGLNKINAYFNEDEA